MCLSCLLFVSVFCWSLAMGDNCCLVCILFIVWIVVLLWFALVVVYWLIVLLGDIC